MPKIGDEKKQKRIDHILYHALDLFAEKGYSETSIDDIANHAGISKGGIYTYFKSKESIFIAIAEIGTGKRQAIVTAVKKKSSFRQKLEMYIESTLLDYTRDENFKRVKLSVEFWVKNYNRSHIGEVTKQEYIDGRFKVFSDDLVQILEGGIESGEFDKDIDIDAVAYTILTGIDGMTYAAAMLNKPITHKRIETFKTMVLVSIISGRKTV